MGFVAANLSIGGSGTSRTVSITPTGTNRAVLAMVCAESGAVTSITCGGNAMTQHGGDLVGTPLFGQVFRLYKLANPTAATQDVIVNFAASGFHVVTVVAVDDADQTTILRTLASRYDAPPFTLSPASANGELVLDFMAASGSSDLTPGAGQTARVTPTEDANGLRHGCSTEVATGASTTMSWTATGSTIGFQLAAAVIAAGGGGAALPRLAASHYRRNFGLL